MNVKMIKTRYCLPIIQRDKNEALKRIQTNEENYGYFEVWLDYIEELDQAFIKSLLDTYGDRLIFTLRRKDTLIPGMGEHKLEETIRFLHGKKCLLDLDITQTHAVNFALSIKMQKQLILSFHDYTRTPEDIYLEKIVEKMRSFKPAIIKISTFCNEPADALRLMKYKRDFLENGEKHIVLGMGESGKITRVFGALWGNEFIFIPEEQTESSAPGQLTRTEFNKILEGIKK